MSQDIKTQADKIEADAIVIDKAVAEIIGPYTDELDEYVRFIHSVVRDDEKPPTDQELEDFTLGLSTRIYFANVGCERLGIRDDLSRLHYKEVYNNVRSKLTGTVADKNTEAELQAQEERVINMIFSNSYKIARAKVDNAQELLGSCKKALSNRMSERELSSMSR